MASSNMIPRDAESYRGLSPKGTVPSTFAERAGAASPAFGADTARMHSACATSGGSMYAIAIHGGAGVLSRGDLPVEQEREYLDGLEAALDAGYQLLERGASSLDAAIA